tara:strand:+ start:24 stop:299 length:276 start_codon:yes stop_codon:yes gene_type:complete
MINMSGVILMSAKQRHKNLTSDRNFLFSKRKHKKEEFAENKRELSKKLEVQIKAYVNSGGQIQKCTPCTYSDGQRLVMTSSQRNRVCGAIK